MRSTLAGRVSRRWFCVLAVAIALVLSIPVAAQAAVVPMDLADLSRAADSVVVVKVAGSTVRDEAQGRSARPDIVTDNKLNVGRIIVGNRATDFTLTQPGGEIGGIGLYVSDVPTLEPGEHAVLFLDAENRIVGGDQGKLTVERGRVVEYGITVNELARAVREYRTSLAFSLPKVGSSVDSVLTAAATEFDADAAISTASLLAISSIGPDKQIAGDERQVTIMGSGFGATSGGVCFACGKSLSGAREPAKIVSWSDTRIEVEVPRAVAAGAVRVTTSSGQSVSRNYNVGFAMLGRQFADSTVSYRINENCPDLVGEGAEIVKAFDVWNAAGSNFRLAYAGTSSARDGSAGLNGQNDIYFEAMNSTALAVNRQWYYTSNNEVIESDIIFNDAYTWGASSSPGVWDIQTVAIHELGHTVGLDDQYSNFDRAMGAALGSTNRRLLSEHEIAGAIHLHGVSSIAPSTTTVTRVAGRDRYATAAAIGHEAFPGWAGVTDVIIASGDNHAMADPLSASGLAGVYNAPILLVRDQLVGGKLPGSTESAIAAIKKANGGNVRFRVVGGTTVIPANVYNRLSALKGPSGTIARTAGRDRYATSTEIAREMLNVAGSAGVPGVLVANGQDAGAFFDALAASPAVYRTNRPLLLVQRDKVPSTVRYLLASSGFTGKPRIVVNASGRVSDSVYAGVGASQRLASSTERKRSAVQIADKMTAAGWLSSGSVAVANGLPDALTGGAAMGELNGPMLYTDADQLFSGTANWISGRSDTVDTVVVVGGEAVVSPLTFSALTTAAQ